jgi:hypothetical protein
MKSDEKRLALLQVGISAATLLLTPVFSALVVDHQLSREHRGWVRQQRFDRSRAYLDRRLELLEDVNAGVMKLEVEAKDIRLRNAVVKATSTLTGLRGAAAVDHVVPDSRSLDELLVKYHYDLADLGSKLQLVALFFGPKVQGAIPKLNGALERNYQAGNAASKGTKNSSTELMSQAGIEANSTMLHAVLVPR